MRRRGFIALGLAAAVRPLAAAAQQMAASIMHVLQQPYNVESWGEFRRMMMTGDFTPKVRLGDVMAKLPTTGVGAISGARGEISILGGKLFVSYGKPGPEPASTSDSAALLAVATANDWQTLTVEHDVPPSDIESYLAATAKAHGVDPDKTFPFQARGAVTSYIMHVNAAPSNGPHGMGMPMAITVVSQGGQLDGQVAGLYVSPDLVGVATHGGERTHAHWISADGTSTAHLDQWGLKAGTSLLLPRL